MQKIRTVLVKAKNQLNSSLLIDKIWISSGEIYIKKIQMNHKHKSTTIQKYNESDTKQVTVDTKKIVTWNYERPHTLDRYIKLVAK